MATHTRLWSPTRRGGPLQRVVAEGFPQQKAVNERVCSLSGPLPDMALEWGAEVQFQVSEY